MLKVKYVDIRSTLIIVCMLIVKWQFLYATHSVNSEGFSLLEFLQNLRFVWKINGPGFGQQAKD